MSEGSPLLGRKGAESSSSMLLASNAGGRGLTGLSSIGRFGFLANQHLSPSVAAPQGF